MDVSFEKDSLDLSQAIRLPAKARFNDRTLPVRSWSLKKIVIEEPLDLAVIDGESVLELVLPFPAHDCVLRVGVRPLPSPEPGMAHLEVVSLTPSARRLIRSYLESCVEGIGEEPLVVIDGGDEEARYDLVPPLSASQARANDRRLLRRLPVYGILFLGLVLAAGFVWREFSTITALSGIVEGDVVLYRSPDHSVLHSLHVKEGSRVQAGDALYDLDDRHYVSQRKQLDEIRSRVRDRMAKLRDTISNEAEHTRLFTEAARDQSDAHRSELAELKAQLLYATQRDERAVKLLDKQAIAREEFENIHAASTAARTQVERKERQLSFSEMLIVEAKENRYFSGNAILGQMADLKEKMAAQETELAKIEYQILELDNVIERAHVRASGAGVIAQISRVEGDHLRDGDDVLTLLPEQAGPRVVAARFLWEDVQYLRIGSACQLAFISRGTAGRGRVVAIGRNGLSSKGIASLDREAGGTGVPVKIEILGQADGTLAGEGAFVKVPRSWTFRSFLQRLL